MLVDDRAAEAAVDLVDALVAGDEAVVVGAQRDQVLGVVMRQGLRWVLLGLAAGLLAALLLSRALKSLLYAVNARDPFYYLAAPLLLGLVALLACYLPARRAARVEPAVTLRAEE